MTNALSLNVNYEQEMIRNSLWMALKLIKKAGNADPEVKIAAQKIMEAIFWLEEANVISADEPRNLPSPS